MRIPSKNSCYRIIREMKTLAHIVDHSRQVCRVAVFLADHMISDRIRLNRDLVHAAALLHDITKTRSFKTKENHAVTGAQILCERGYPEVGSIVKQHVRLDNYFSGDGPNEAEIVNYADKRVLHDKIVSLPERMNYILERYGREIDGQQRIRWLWQKTEALEEKLFAYLPVTPDQLGRLVSDEAGSTSASEPCGQDLACNIK